MAECLIAKGGGGSGVISADVTADKAKVLGGYTTVTSDSDDAVVEGTMANQGAVNPAKLSPGGTYTVPEGYHNGTGSVVAKTKNMAKISAVAYRGFSMGSTSDYQESQIDQFTVPSGATDCTVFYSGVAADNAGEGTGTCRVYQNATLKDNRDVTGNSLAIRDTMVNQSFAASAGDVIKVEATAPSGSTVLCFVCATIEYFT